MIHTWQNTWHSNSGFPSPLSRENRPGQTGDRGIDALKSSLFLRLDVDLWDGYTARAEGRGFYDAVYALKGENLYTRQVIQENQSGLEVVNWYVDGRISDQMDLGIGRQVVVWGRSDTVRINDVVNPVDVRRHLAPPMCSAGCNGNLPETARSYQNEKHADSFVYMYGGGDMYGPGGDDYGMCEQ